tara:strand:- start:171 stop:557 length:387 start_codon:yes stop_codon:yes gene_type:complete
MSTKSKEHTYMKSFDLERYKDSPDVLERHQKHCMKAINELDDLSSKQNADLCIYAHNYLADYKTYLARKGHFQCVKHIDHVLYYLKNQSASYIAMHDMELIADYNNESCGLDVCSDCEDQIQEHEGVQ